MDTWDQMLSTIRLRDVSLTPIEREAPWEHAVRDSERGALYVMGEGAAELEVEGLEEPVRIDAGDLVLIPRGAGHVLRGRGAGEARVRMLFATFGIADRDTHPFVPLLPPIVHVRGEEGRPLPWVDGMLELILAESRSPRPGGNGVLSRMADVLVVQVLRSWLESLSDAPSIGGWLGALGDPAIAQSLGLVHEHLGAPWTVAGLAARVGLSRSAFAARFTERVGESPLQHVTRWRMHAAARLLREGRVPIPDIARRVGYDSEAAFSKTFKRWVGVAPGGYRRTHQAPTGTRLVIPRATAGAID